MPLVVVPQRIQQPGGERAPHVVVDRDGEAVSTHDLLRRDFLLLAGPEAEAWCDAARNVSESLGMDVDAFRIGRGGELGDPDGRFAEVYGTGAEGAVLVRPDGFVAWRTRGTQADARDVLGNVLGRVLARS